MNAKSSSQNVAHNLSSEDVREWAARDLLSGWNSTLSIEVGRSFGEHASTYEVFASSARTRSELLDFRTGGKVAPGPSPDGWIKDFIRAELQQGKFFVVADWMARPEDPFLKSYGVPYASYGQEVYQVITTPDFEQHSYAATMLPNHLPFMHSFIIEDASRAPAAGAAMDRAMIDDLASRVTAIVFGVYDAESHLLCRFVRPER